MKFYYSVNEKQDIEDYRFEYEDRFAYTENELWMVMHDIAHHYWYEHDGWDHTSWPNDFYLWSENKQYLGKFSVDLEMEPSFTTSRVEDGDI